MGKSTDKGFIQIPNWYFECGLTLIQVNTLAQIASYQRQDKQYFRSAESLACMFGVSYSHMRKVLSDLVDMGIIKKKGKVKRMWKYQIDVNRLEQYRVKAQCKPPQEDSATTKHKDERYCSQEAQIVPPGSNYNTNKTSLNKTSFKGNESILDRSSPTTDEVLFWAKQLNLDK